MENGCENGMCVMYSIMYACVCVCVCVCVVQEYEPLYQARLQISASLPSPNGLSLPFDVLT